MSKDYELTDAQISDIVALALSDHISFAEIQLEYGLKEKEVKALMRDTIKTGSYRAWRKRIRSFGDRREHYK